GRGGKGWRRGYVWHWISLWRLSHISALLPFSKGRGSRWGVRHARLLSGNHYLASIPGRIPPSSVNVEPTLPTIADLRVSPARSRRRYTASMPVQCAPSKFATLNSFSLSPVQFSCSSLAANRCRPPTTPYTGLSGNFCFV